MATRNPPGKPGSSVKLSAKKRTPSTNKSSATPRYLNTTTSSSSKTACTPITGPHSSFKQNLTTTFNANRTSFGKPKVKLDVVVVPTTDWELECDLAYNEYLQAIMKRQLMQRKITEMKTSINDQLSIQSELLFKDKIELTEMRHEIQVAKLQTEMQEAVRKLGSSLDTLLHICSESNLEKHFDNIINVLDTVKNRIELDNIEPLKTEKEYDQLSAALVKCNETLLRIKETTNNYKKIEELASCLSETLELKKQIREKVTQLEEKENNLGHSALKGISDYFTKLEN